MGKILPLFENNTDSFRKQLFLSNVNACLINRLNEGCFFRDAGEKGKFFLPSELLIPVIKNNNLHGYIRKIKPRDNSIRKQLGQVFPYLIE